MGGQTRDRHHPRRSLGYRGGREGVRNRIRSQRICFPCVIMSVCYRSEWPRRQEAKTKMPINPNNLSQAGAGRSLTGTQIRQTLLAEIGDRSGLQTRSVLERVCQQLGLNNSNEQLPVLTVFHDLFRTGHLAWGSDALNASPPHFHVTEQGRTALRSLSRDPINPDGYLAYLNTPATLNPVAASYIDEALRTFNADCYKATAVMTGCAAESVTLELRDALMSKMQSLSQPPPPDLTAWQIARVVRAISTVLDPKKPMMPQRLREAYEVFWLGFTGQIRMARNEAGHPTSIDPVSYETVHASLLIFPEQAKLTSDLAAWVTASYT